MTEVGVRSVEDRERNREIYRRYYAGETLTSIGLSYNLTITRIHQIIDREIRRQEPEKPAS